MITIGVDSHKHSLTAVALDSTGRDLDALQVSSTPEGRTQLLAWARSLAPAGRQWGIEGSGMYGRPLAQQLAQLGDRVYEVPGQATARERRAGIGTHRQKTDSSDARAVARVTLREGTRLPRVFPTGAAHQCRLWSEHRDNLVLQRTQLMNQLHAHASLLDPLQMPEIRATRGRAVLTRWATQGVPSSDPLQCVQGQIIQQLARLILVYDEMIQQLTRELKCLAEKTAPSLVAMRGVGPVTAAKILGEAGDLRRFASRAKFASYCGVAPVEASSGSRVRHRLSRRGNRQLNCALHTIAITQRRWDPNAKLYLQRKVAEGKPRKAALRCLKRHLANVVFRLLTETIEDRRDATTTIAA